MKDMKMFDSYRKDYTRNTSGKAYCSVEHLLRFWQENKAQYLAPLFGDELILEKKVTYDKPVDQLRSEMYRVLENFDAFTSLVTKSLAKVMNIDEWGYRSKESEDEIVWRNLRYSLCNAHALTVNELELGYDGYDSDGQPKYIKSYTIDFGNGKKVQLQRGMKITRAFTQICKALDMSDDWEEFRIQHSQVLNTKRMTGTLCLSIHPLDYATASDNDNGWSSCMSWSDYGCYRMGTVEMMNSPMVICAYLKSNKQHMEIAGEEWNSKKWRAWVIVTKDVILVNRHYPYHQEEMAVQCINWVRDLVSAAYGWKYEDPKTDFYRWMRDEADYEVEFCTNYMYNDLGGDDVIGCFREGWKPRTMPGCINFSGPAECMVCGDEIMPESQGADMLECEECFVENRCCNCGEVLSDDDCYHDPDGNVLCYDCWDSRCVNCQVCDSTVYRDDAVNVQFPIHRGAFDQWKKVFDPEYRNSRHTDIYNSEFQWMFSGHGEDPTVTICEDCARKFDVNDLEYSEAEQEKDGVQYSEYQVFNPNRISVEKAMNLLNAPGWEYANYMVRKIKSGRYFGDEEDKEETLFYYQSIIDFWTDQWDRFQKDFDNADEDTDR